MNDPLPFPVLYRLGATSCPVPTNGDAMPANFDQAKGRAKEGLGGLTGNKNLKKQGKVDQGKGGLKELLGTVTDTLKGVLNKKK